jgi:hypothetical protein
MLRDEAPGIDWAMQLICKTDPSLAIGSPNPNKMKLIFFFFVFFQRFHQISSNIKSPQKEKEKKEIPMPRI